MNNVQLNRFASTPVNVEMSRSRFERPFRHLTTGDAGKLIPVACWDVLPGDTVKMDVAAFVRMATPLFPVMDDAYMDVHFYFVPLRILWEHWKEFCGESSSAWAQTVVRTIPQIKFPNYYNDGTTQNAPGWAKGTVADYLGLPTLKGNQYTKVNALPFRAYAKIWNDYWRDENIQDEVNIPLTDSDMTGYNMGISASLNNSYTSTYEQYCLTGYQSYGACGGAPLPVCKLHDYFTSCLPSPQCGTAVPLPLSGNAPIVNATTPGKYFSPKWFSNSSGSQSGITAGGEFIGLNGTNPPLTYGASSSGTVASADWAARYLNLAADLSQVTATTVNALREAFALQRFFEKLALGGHRYIELVRTMFGVTSPDGRVQRAEFLGGKRFPLNMTSVAQTSAQVSNGTTVGALGAYSQTADHDSYFVKSFTEHGFIMAVCCIRTNRTYQQGIAPMFLRQTLTDFYWPAFANIGEQPVLKKQIFFSSSTVDDQVFGYQEAYADYRYSPNRVSGALRSNFAQSLDAWHYADNYVTTPTLNPGWIREPQSNVARTLADQTLDQFIMDFAFQGVWTRVMPMYSVPGLIDHH